MIYLLYILNLVCYCVQFMAHHYEDQIFYLNYVCFSKLQGKGDIFLLLHFT